jgi:hypothetical protein
MSIAGLLELRTNATPAVALRASVAVLLGALVNARTYQTTRHTPQTAPTVTPMAGPARFNLSEVVS